MVKHLQHTVDGKRACRLMYRSNIKDLGVKVRVCCCSWASNWMRNLLQGFYA